MKFFTKVRQLTLLQSARDCLIDCQLRKLFFFVLLQKTTGFITLRQGLQNVTIFTACNSTLPSPSLPSLEFKGMP